MAWHVLGRPIWSARDPSAFAVGDAMFPLTPAQAEQVRQFLASIPEAK